MQWMAFAVEREEQLPDERNNLHHIQHTDILLPRATEGTRNPPGFEDFLL
jgi:hypothetical protein